MNRIAEIERDIEIRTLPGGSCIIPSDDIHYLLALLGVAERALERYANLHKMMYDDGIKGELYEHWWIRQSKHAVEALQLIRE